MKNDWLGLCVEMMMGYVPQNINTQQENNKHLEISDHFISVLTLFSTKTKAGHYDNNTEQIEEIKRLIKRAARQNLEFLRNWAIKEGVL